MIDKPAAFASPAARPGEPPEARNCRIGNAFSLPGGIWAPPGTGPQFLPLQDNPCPGQMFRECFGQLKVKIDQPQRKSPSILSAKSKHHSKRE
ncbi:hypothetical protein [Ferrovibrio sp.]|uniref:hypothetical protein n=1 Tax=Ferrovibrio sp. TaxID=1917215 RepID=UPI003D0C6A4B